MRTPRMSRQSIAPRLLLSLTLALSLLFATASSVFADGHEGTLPSSGGTIEFASGVTVKTPDGASSSDVTVTYTALEEDAIPGEAAEGTALGSLVFTLDAGGATFKQFAEVTIPFSDDDLAAAADGRTDNVGVSSWDAVSGSWIELFPIRDILNNTLTISQQSLGTYAVVVTLPTGEVEATPTATVAPTEVAPVEPDPPPTGGFGVSNSLMMGLLLMGALFLMGGGYVLARNRNR